LHCAYSRTDRSIGRKCTPDAARIDQEALTALSRDLSSDAHKDIKGLVILRDN
jgi:CubicO group peptidase (beta-lactamase class C family)